MKHNPQRLRDGSRWSAGIGGAVLLALLAGCNLMPDQIVVRDEAGNKLAEADPNTGRVIITWYGLEVIRPKLMMPERKK